MPFAIHSSDIVIKIVPMLINNIDIGFSEKNIAEELMAYAKQKMNY